MFRACFVARISPSDKAVQLFLQYQNPVLSPATSLPSVQNLGQFCFPLGPDKVEAREYASPQEHSYTLTGGDGSHLHGFCRMFLPPRTNEVDARGRSLTLRYPQVLCIISPFPWLTFYSKVLRTVEQYLREQGLLNKAELSDLPASSFAALFLDSLLKECKTKPQLGRIITVSLPSRSNVCVSPQHRIQGIKDGSERDLQSNKEFVEFQIPPDTGNGSWNAGISLARLLWHLPPDALLALLQALLLEKRILMVSEDRNALSASLHATAALLYPFRWQHIYLPILPHSLIDYLSAPMPFLIGLPLSKNFNGLASIDLEEVVCVDLDSGTCCLGGLQGQPLDYTLLPWSHHLKPALQSKVYPRITGPLDFVNTPIIGLCLQEYFLKLMGTYRDFIELDGPDEEGNQEEIDNPTGARRTHQDDGYLRLNGYRFDHLEFVENQRRSERAKEFLKLMRHSQMYEVFINERMALAAGGYQSKDTFESRVSYLQAKKGNVTKRVAQVGAKGVHNFSAMLQRTTTFVKSGVSQIRHSNSIGEAFDVVVRPTPQVQSPAEPIVPSYSIDLDSRPPTHDESKPDSHSNPPPKSETSSSEKEGASPTFFDHDPNAEDDRPPVPIPERTLSPLRQRFSGPSSPPPGTAHSFATVASPRSAEPESFEALLNLDGVDGVFLPSTSYVGLSNGNERGQNQTTSLLDDPAGTPSSDLSSWGLGLPAASEFQEAASAAAESVSTTVAEWASKVQNLALNLTNNESQPTTPELTPVALQSHQNYVRAPSYDIQNSASLGTIDAFWDFKTPEAKRASSCTKLSTPKARSDSALQLQIPAHFQSPGIETLSTEPTQSGKTHTTPYSFRNSTLPTPSTLGREPSSVRSSQLNQSMERSGKDPFSTLDPIAKRDASQPMCSYKSGQLS